MKKLLILAIGAMLLTACTGKDGKSNEDILRQQIDSLKNASDQKDQEIDEFMSLVDQVNEGFKSIKEAEGRLEITDGNIEANKKEQIAENMQFIQDQMNNNRILIDQLKKKLENSGINLKALQKQIDMLEDQLAQQKATIDELQIQLQERDATIAQQGEQIETLNENVTTLQNDNEQKQAKVEQQDKELNKAWFVFGTKSELKSQKILDNGDVLKNGSFNKGYFTEVDIRTHKSISFYSKSAKVLTNHPSGSYELVKNSRGEYELHITDASKFWSVSKYLVVQVK